MDYEAIHVFDHANSRYVAINNDALIDYNTTGGSIASTNISPFQGIWIKTENDGIFTVKESWRTADTVTQVFSKTSSVNLLRLNAMDDDGSLDQVVLTFNSQAEEGFNSRKDAYKIPSAPDRMELYINKPDRWLAIEELPDQDIPPVDISFRFAEDSRSATIFMDPNQLLVSGNVYLEDLYLHVLVDLENGPYTFNRSQPDMQDRFRLHFTSLSAYELQNKLENPMKVYVSDRILNVTIKDAAFHEMKFRISDLSGMRNTTRTLQWNK